MPDLSTANQAMARPRVVFTTACLIFFIFTGLYLFLPPNLASQPWDSLQYGYSIEVEGIRSIQGNHPLGHLIFFAVFSLAKQLGYEGRALIISQIINGILGGLIVAIFFTTLVSMLKVKALFALGFSLILGTCYSFRFFAGTGDIYHFSILFSLLAWASLIYEVTLRDRLFPILAGIFTGLSILSHQLNAVLVPVGLVLILLAPGGENQTKKGKLTRIASFLGASLVVTLLGYLLLGYLATSSYSLTRVIGWMRGYFGDPTYGRYLSTGFLKTAWLTLSQTVLFSPRHSNEFFSSGILAFLGTMMLLGLCLSRNLTRRKQVIMLASALQCLVTWLLNLWWEPQNPKFWLLTLIPWFMVLALSFEALEPRILNRLPKFGTRLSHTLITLPFLIAFVLVWANLRYPAGDIGMAGFHQAMNIWLYHSSPGDVILTAGDLIPQLRYWGNRPNTLFLYRSLQASQFSVDKFTDFRAEINQALCKHHAVLITPAASEYISDSELSLLGVTRDELRSYLYETARQGDILFWYRNVWDEKVLPVYAIKRSAACLDRKSILNSVNHES